MFQLERKTYTLDVFILFCCLALNGSEINVAIFWTNILMRSSVSGGIALSPTFLGQSVSLNTASPTSSSGNENKNAYRYETLSLQIKHDFMYIYCIF